jgi:hypothetical protein
MAHPDTDEVLEAVDVRPADDDAAAVDAFDRILSDDEEADGEDPGDDDAEVIEDEIDEGEEPEAPAIPAPVSFNAEEKAVFATMTPEQQQSVAAIEARRNMQVQQATTRAAEAERDATANAQAQVVEIQRQYAAGLEQYEAMFQAPRPDYSLIQTNPQEYQRQLMVYEQMNAYRENIAQQRTEAESQAKALEAQQKERFDAEQRSILARDLPEWNDPVKRQEIATRIVEAAKHYRFEDDELVDLSARDILALNEIANDRADAVKYRDLMAKRMEAVRSAKGKPAPVQMKPGTAQPKGSGQARAFSEASTRLRQTGSDADALAAFEAMGL